MGNTVPNAAHLHKESDVNNLRREVNDLRGEVNDLRTDLLYLYGAKRTSVEPDSPRISSDHHLPKKKIHVRDDVHFSLIIPSRERKGKLENCLHSFFSKASRRSKVEAIVLIDNCDVSMRDFGNFITQNQMNVKMMSVWRSDMMIRDYNNYGAQCSSGKYLWILNDDVEMITDDWDRILKEKIEMFCEANGDRCCYVSIDDNTHVRKNLTESHGCCFPILTREAVDAMNGIMPEEICYWGADVALHTIFRSLPENRILDLLDEIKILHHCRHNTPGEVDDISRRIERICVTENKNGINADQQEEYVDRLRSIMRFRRRSRSSMMI